MAKKRKIKRNKKLLNLMLYFWIFYEKKELILQTLIELNIYKPLFMTIIKLICFIFSLFFFLNFDIW